MNPVFRIDIGTDNAAFAEENLTNELSQCLDRVQDKIDKGETSGVIMDTNGNKVGRFDLLKDIE